MSINIQSSSDLQRKLAAKAKARRLAENLSRRTLANKSGVSQASIKRFETSGEVSLSNLLNIAFALNCTKEFDVLFDPKAPDSIAELQASPRQRGSQ